MIDHLLWAVPELQNGCRQMKAWTGVEPALGGRHPGVGTHNALLSLGEGSYLEVIAPDPTQERYSGLGTLVQGLETPTLLTWCAGTTELDTIHEAAQRAGLTQSAPIAMSRRRPDGIELHWRILLLDNHPFGPLVPFFIQWDTEHHPSQSTPSGCTLEGFQLHHPDPLALNACFEPLDLEVEVVKASHPGLVATLSTPRGRLVLPPTGRERSKPSGASSVATNRS